MQVQDGYQSSIIEVGHPSFYLGSVARARELPWHAVNAQPTVFVERNSHGVDVPRCNGFGFGGVSWPKCKALILYTRVLSTRRIDSE